MFKIASFLLFICLLAFACDKVKDTPAPNVLTGIELKDLNTSLVLNGKGDVDLASLNQFNEEVSIRIKTQPQNGSLTLDELRKVYVYEPNFKFSGKDSAEYEVCSPPICKSAWIYFVVVDTTKPVIKPVCNLPIETLTFIVNSAGLQSFTLPDTFACKSTFSQFTSDLPEFVSFNQGKVFVNFLKSATIRIKTETITFKSCTLPDSCKTGQIILSINIPADSNEICKLKLNPQNDLFTEARNIIAKSYNYKDILKNDSACTTGDIKPESLSIETLPKRGKAELRSNIQGRFLRYTLDTIYRNQPGLDSLTYRIQTISGASKTAKIFFKIQ